MKKIIKTDQAPAAIGPYNQGIVANGFVFTAGQIALDAVSGEIEGDDIQAQTHKVLKNLAAVLTAGGASLKSVVKTTVFLKDMNNFTAMNAVYAEYFTDSVPARSAVEVVRLPKDVLVEIEAVALVE